jgi:hypothetical protein
MSKIACHDWRNKKRWRETTDDVVKEEGEKTKRREKYYHVDDMD